MNLLLLCDLARLASFHDVLSSGRLHWKCVEPFILLSFSAKDSMALGVSLFSTCWHHIRHATSTHVINYVYVLYYSIQYRVGGTVWPATAMAMTAANLKAGHRHLGNKEKKDRLFITYY